MHACHAYKKKKKKTFRRPLRKMICKTCTTAAATGRKVVLGQIYLNDRPPYTHSLYTWEEAGK